MPEKSICPTLESRVVQLETIVCNLIRSNGVDLTSNYFNDARFSALYSIVQDLTVQTGLTRDEFFEHYRNRVRWWHQWHLENAEARNPALAAEMDKRTEEMISETPERYSPLFPRS